LEALRDAAVRRDTVMWVLAETIRRVTLLVQPFMPESTAKILDQLRGDTYTRAFRACRDLLDERVELGKKLDRTYAEISASTTRYLLADVPSDLPIHQKSLNNQANLIHQQIVAQPTSVNLPFVRDVMFTNGVDFFTTTGAADPPYAFGNFLLEATKAGEDRLGKGVVAAAEERRDRRRPPTRLTGVSAWSRRARIRRRLLCDGRRVRLGRAAAVVVEGRRGVFRHEDVAGAGLVVAIDVAGGEGAETGEPLTCT